MSGARISSSLAVEADSPFANEADSLSEILLGVVGDSPAPSMGEKKQVPMLGKLPNDIRLVMNAVWEAERNDVPSDSVFWGLENRYGEVRTPRLSNFLHNKSCRFST